MADKQNYTAVIAASGKPWRICLESMSDIMRYRLEKDPNCISAEEIPAESSGKISAGATGDLPRLVISDAISAIDYDIIANAAGAAAGGKLIRLTGSSVCVGYMLPPGSGINAVSIGKTAGEAISGVEDLDLGDVYISSLRILRAASEAARLEVIDRLTDSGVEFFSVDGVVISPLSEISGGASVLPCTLVRGKSSVGRDTVIGPNTVIENSSVGDNCRINAVQIYESKIGNDVRIGPFCHIRPNSDIRDGVRIGDFVEVKNSVIGDGTHASHLTYIGDSDVGKKVNFGCGTVTVNYNGMSKARCEIRDSAFIGCNTNLVAPVTIGEEAYTAAGSTITIDVPAGALAISRTREQRIVEGWVKRRKSIN